MIFEDVKADVTCLERMVVQQWHEFWNMIYTDCLVIWVREKGRYPTQSCDKNPYTHRTIQEATWQHKNATKNFDYTTIAGRLRTVSWSNSSHPTGVVKARYKWCLQYKQTFTNIDTCKKKANQKSNETLLYNLTIVEFSFCLKYVEN